jgi:hypothetical protein
MLWDKRVPIYDTFTLLGILAVNTERLRLGTTVSPLVKTKPWILARQTVTLDHLSNGRLTFGVGLGIEETVDYARWDENNSPKILGEKLDESLEILIGLWKGKPFQYNGKHYRVKKKTTFLPKPVQTPRILIWTSGYWPRKTPFQRALRWDGAIPLVYPGKLPSPKEISAVTNFIQKHRKLKGNFDIANIGWTTGTNHRKDREKVTRFREAGATWWLESLWTKRDSPVKMLARVKQGPPN